MNTLNEQQIFWVEEYAKDYMQKNAHFNETLGIRGWNEMLKKGSNIQSILECGCNIGRNIYFLNHILPDTEKSVIEISKPAYDYVISRYPIKSSFNGPIVESNFNVNSFDLTFTCGVLIHVHPDDLIANMKKLYDYSKKYILIGEYFNRTPIMLEYHGKLNKLFKRDFGQLFIQTFKVTLLDYGFLWGYIYDDAGFDDITWWLFEKK